MQRESSPSCSTSGVTQCVLLGVSLPLSISIRGLFLHNARLFFTFFFYFCVCGPAVSMRKHPKKCRSALLRVLFDSNRGTVGPGRGTGGFEHAHIVSLKGQAAR